VAVVAVAKVDNMVAVFPLGMEDLDIILGGWHWVVGIHSLAGDCMMEVVGVPCMQLVDHLEANQH